MVKKLDATGYKRGSLTAVSCTGIKSNGGGFKWNFLCDCGNTHIMSICDFRSKPFPCCKVCGRARLSRHSKTHGLTGTKVYTAWLNAKNRCFDPKDKAYKNYGGRGITMDQELVDSVELWYKTLGDPPEDGKSYSVDRINCTGNYSIGNIKWSTAAEQARNRNKVSSNTSGYTGVYFTESNAKYVYAAAQWSTNILGISKVHTKRFSVKKYGLLPAFKHAIEYRLKMIEELNELGAGYSSKHGQ